MTLNDALEENDNSTDIRNNGAGGDSGATVTENHYEAKPVPC